MKNSKWNRPEDGFTLIELIVVIAIIGILATFVVPNVMGRTDQAKVAKVKQDFKALDTQCKMFRTDHGRYPDSIDELINPPRTSTGSLTLTSTRNLSIPGPTRFTSSRSSMDAPYSSVLVKT